MAIYLPTAAVGNGGVLATLGGAGEIMTFFYPRIDFAQNVHECLPALYIGEPGQGRFLWTFGPQFQRRQHYLPQTNVATTELKLATPPLTLTFQDFCLGHATPTGLLPELIGTDPSTPYWAAPHSWASGLLIECVLALDELAR